ncbi:protein of unknown function [Serratia sp. Tan611]|nr:protein of unknown function [Serratia sp. Tan611]
MGIYRIYIAFESVITVVYAGNRYLSAIKNGRQESSELILYFPPNLGGMIFSVSSSPR